MKIPAYDPSDGPPVLVLTSWASVLVQRLMGYRKPTALFGKRHRSATRRIAAFRPDKLDNLRFEQLEIPPGALAELREWRLDTIREQNAKKKYYEPFEETEARVKRAAIPRGLASAFFTGLPDLQEGRLPHMRRRAEELDSLSNVLLAQQLDGKGGSLKGYKNALLDSPLVPPEHWIVPGQNRDLRPSFEQAADWQTAWKITNIIIFHQQIALLALWDAELCADGELRAIPLFLQLAPRSRACAGEQTVGLRRLTPRQDNVIDNPFGQLLDLVWCRLYRISNGNWPTSFPTDAKMSETFNNYIGDLSQLRAGRPNLTMSRFEALWPDNVRNRRNELIAPPITLLAVAHLWNLMIPKAPLVPVDQCYMRAWHSSRRKLGVYDQQGPLADDCWPEYLDRGLDYPAPE